eukprot:GHVQ01020306.1.p1 GENE.GHVQ01020306.1~~GHVQ01020306.1.p1  ORF type:complete len:794 (+),score=174.45 GHVQ01020306.1:233-2614(+)
MKRLIIVGLALFAVCGVGAKAFSSVDDAAIVDESAFGDMGDFASLFENLFSGLNDSGDVSGDARRLGTSEGASDWSSFNLKELVAKLFNGLSEGNVLPELMNDDNAFSNLISGGEDGGEGKMGVQDIIDLVTKNIFHLAKPLADLKDGEENLKPKVKLSKATKIRSMVGNMLNLLTNNVDELKNIGNKFWHNMAETAHGLNFNAVVNFGDMIKRTSGDAPNAGLVMDLLAKVSRGVLLSEELDLPVLREFTIDGTPLLQLLGEKTHQSEGRLVEWLTNTNAFVQDSKAAQEFDSPTEIVDEQWPSTIPSRSPALLHSVLAEDAVLTNIKLNPSLVEDLIARMSFITTDYKNESRQSLHFEQVSYFYGRYAPYVAAKSFVDYMMSTYNVAYSVSGNKSLGLATRAALMQFARKESTDVLNAAEIASLSLVLESEVAKPQYWAALNGKKAAHEPSYQNPEFMVKTVHNIVQHAKDAAYIKAEIENCTWCEAADEDVAVFLSDNKAAAGASKGKALAALRDLLLNRSDAGTVSSDSFDNTLQFIMYLLEAGKGFAEETSKREKYMEVFGAMGRMYATHRNAASFVFQKQHKELLDSFTQDPEKGVESLVSKAKYTTDGLRVFVVPVLSSIMFNTRGMESSLSPYVPTDAYITYRLKELPSMAKEMGQTVQDVQEILEGLETKGDLAFVLKKLGEEATADEFGQKLGQVLKSMKGAEFDPITGLSLPFEPEAGEEASSEEGGAETMDKLGEAEEANLGSDSGSDDEDTAAVDSADEAVEAPAVDAGKKKRLLRASNM